MKSFLIAGVIIVVVIVSYIIISKNKSPAPEMALDAQNMKTLKITSPAFEDGFSIPSKYTCDGEGISPPLEISGVPEAAKSLALIVEDPDIPDSAKQALGTDIFDHWVKWNIPATTTEIKEGMEPAGVSGKGGSGQLTYVAPCPPDKEHRYFFKFYALDSKINLPEGSSKQELEKVMADHIIASGELMGRYNRSR